MVGRSPFTNLLCSAWCQRMRQPLHGFAKRVRAGWSDLSSIAPPSFFRQHEQLQQQRERATQLETLLRAQAEEMEALRAEREKLEERFASLESSSKSALTTVERQQAEMLAIESRRAAAEQALHAPMDLLEGVASRLKTVQADSESVAFEERLQQESRVQELRLQLLRQHQGLGLRLTATSFANLESLWQKLSTAKRELSFSEAAEQRVLSDVSRTGSRWTLEQLAVYMPKIQRISWQEDAAFKELSWHQTGELPALLRADLKNIRRMARPMASTGASSGSRKVAVIADRLIETLEAMGMACFAGGKQSGKFDGLIKLSESGAREATSRAVIDAIMLPLCRECGVSAILERAVGGAEKEPGLPKSISDYILLRNSGPDASDIVGIGAIEAKRCLAGAEEVSEILSGAIVQCFFQMLALRAEASSPPHALLGVVSDGRRWLCLELHATHLSVTPLLDLVKEPSLHVLLGFLRQRLRPGWSRPP
eukprot:TRINITY_DN58365_c0_g1_i1.p1 TRINITY_DN58365_c0_g1~~TRINITY_DN58365_c0_g1_i1.p1  ORF type:complete len:482 (-),score=78.65 TRINITY_DN58365_c0_g1_i1:83-1528(-)